MRSVLRNLTKFERCSILNRSDGNVFVESASLADQTHPDDHTARILRFRRLCGTLDELHLQAAAIYRDATADARARADASPKRKRPAAPRKKR